MRSRVEVLGHPAHQIAVMFPLGALGLSVCADLLHTITGRKDFARAATLALNFGIGSAALAAPFGLVDWLAINKGTRAKRVGAWHAVGNLAVLGLFSAARLVRDPDRPSAASKCLSATGFLLSHATAWAGTELVNRHGIGVHDVMGEDVQSSLSGDGRADQVASEESAPLLPGIEAWANGVR